MAQHSKTPAHSTGKGAKRITSFRRQNYGLKKRVGDAWRKPRGIDNKQRVGRQGAGYMPRIGYRTPVQGRGLHPSGLYEVLVHNVKELEKLDKSRQAAKIGGAVGAKKRVEISKKAMQMGVKILN